MTIAFDIDGTWTLDPNLFQRVASVFQLVGWKVIIITASEQPLDKLQRLGLRGNFEGVWDFPIIVSGPDLKEEAARKAGYKVDVWVDDMPGMIQNCRIIGGERRGQPTANPRRP